MIARPLVCWLLLFLAGAGASAADRTLTEERGIDLSEATWTFEVPDRGAETVSLPTTLVSPVGWGVLRTEFDVESVGPERADLLATELVIGHIQGGDEVFLNSNLIGASSGMAISAAGIPRRYLIPSGTLHFGSPNTLEIRVRSLGGGPQIAVGGPLTLAPLGNQGVWAESARLRRDLERNAQALWLIAEELPLSAQERHRLGTVHRALVTRVAEADAMLGQGAPGQAAMTLGDVQEALRGFSLSLEEQHQRALESREEATERRHESLAAELGDRGADLRLFRSGFGRFGHWHEEGTPFFTRVTPMEVRGHGQMGWRLRLDELHGTEVAAINWVSKTTLLTGSLDGEETDVAVTISTPYPGVLFEVQRGDEIAFELTGVEIDDLEITAMPEWFGSMPRLPEIGESRTLLVRRLAEEETFWLVHSDVPVARAQVRATEGNPVLTLTLRAGSEGRVALIPVHGSALVDTREIGWPEYEAFRRVRSLAEHVPVRLDEHYLVDRIEGRVLLFDQWHHRTVGQDNPLIERPVWYPPIARFAAEQMDQAIEFEARRFEQTPLMTTQGPAAVALHTTGTARWSLPLPSTGGRFHVRPYLHGDLVDTLNLHLTDLGERTMINAVDRTYKSRAQGYQVWNLLDEENRDRLQENSAALIPLTFDRDIWHETIEPFTGTPTWYTYTIEGPAFDLYDQDWGNGLPLYALSLWAMVEGDWGTLIPHRPVIEQIGAWYRETEDWAWMRNSNANHGHGTGAGDCSLASYAGLLGEARIWSALGEDEHRDEALLLLARTAVSITSRFGLTAWARSQGLIGPDSVAIGFHEGEGYLTGSLSGYPWNVTSMLSGNGVQPEAHDLMLERAPAEYARLEREVLQANPTIFDGEADYGYPTLYQGNSGYITLPHLYAQARLGTPVHQLRDWLESAYPNQYLWWQAPTTLAEIAARDNGFTLSDWSPAHLVDGWVDQAGDVNVIFEPKLSPLEWEARMNERPVAVTVGGEEVSWTWVSSTNTLRVSAWATGPIQFTVER